MFWCISRSYYNFFPWKVRLDIRIFGYLDALDEYSTNWQIITQLAKKGSATVSKGKRMLLFQYNGNYWIKYLVALFVLVLGK